MKYKPALFVIITVSALLRFGGLSHDLHEGKVYHPDTPKQVRATERFLEGNYYRHTGIADYDGYPYFNSHLVEYLYRAGEPFRFAALRLLGVPVESRLPGVLTLFWITLLFNATVATLTVWLVFRLVREHYGAGAALVAAAFMALSPVDVTACHYANGDTTAAFFATLSLLFALRIARDGRWRDYLLAVIFAACGFAAKYHAGLAALPILIAHAARYPSPRAFFSRASWSRLLVCALAGIATLFITIPTLIGHTSQVVQDIIYFFTHVSKSRRLPAEVRDTGITGKFLFSMRRNGPILLYIFGPVAAAASILALVRLTLRDVRLLIIGILPLVYFLVGVSFRPIAPPVYHTLMTPMVFILAAVFLTRRFNTGIVARRLWTGAAAVAIAASIGYLGRQALKETFFQWHMDTRRMANAWVAENVPDTFLCNRGLYTFKPPAPPPAHPDGTVFIRSSIYPDPAPDAFHPLKIFALERDSLMMFRNPDIITHIGKSAWINHPVAIPVTQRWPSETGNQFVFDNGLTFLRDSKRILVDADRSVSRRLVTEAALADAFLTVRNGPVPNNISLSFGGDNRTLRLAPGATEAIRIRNPGHAFPRERGLFFYRLSVSATSGPALVRLATRSDEIGMALYEAGRFAEAASWLDDAAVSLRNPTLAVQAVASRRIAGLPAPAKPAVNPAEVMAVANRIRLVVNAGSLEDTYGIGPRYLNALDFLTIPGEALVTRGFKKRSSLRATLDDVDEENPVTLPEPNPDKQQSIVTTPLILDAGHYTCSIRFTYAPLPEQTPALTLIVALPDGTPLSGHPLDLSSCAPYQRVERTASVFIPGQVPGIRLMLRPAKVAGMTIHRLSLAPDILATVNGWKTILDLVDGGPAADASNQPMAFELLMAKGDQAAATQPSAALDFFMAAARARPESLLPASRIAALAPKLPASASLAAGILAPYQARQSLLSIPIGARFQNGLRLDSALLRETEVEPGSKLGMNLYWDVESPVKDPDSLVVWIHFRDAQGKTVFQGDHDLAHDLALTRSPLYTQPYFTEIQVPPAIKPGRYRVRLGLYIPTSRDRIRITGSRIPAQRTSIEIPQTITVK